MAKLIGGFKRAGTARGGAMLCVLGTIVVAMFAAASLSIAATIPIIESTLSDTQKASLDAALAAKPKLSYGQIIKQALAEEMPCEEVVAYLCAKVADTPKAAEKQQKIVYAAIVEGTCDAGKVITRALQAGAPLRAVVEAAVRAGVDQKVIAAAAADAGYTAEQIAAVFLNLFTAGAGPGPGGPSAGEWKGGTGGPPPTPTPTPPPPPPPASPSLP